MPIKPDLGGLIAYFHGVSAQACYQRRWADVRVAREHLHGAVPADRSNLHGIQPEFKETRHGFMTKVVKMQIAPHLLVRLLCDACAGASESHGNRMWANGEYSTIKLLDDLPASRQQYLRRPS